MLADCSIRKYPKTIITTMKAAISLMFVLSSISWTADAKLCYMEILPPAGIVIYPLMKSQSQGIKPPLWWGTTKPRICFLYMDVDIKQHVKMVFRSISLGENTLTIEAANARNVAAWSQVRVIKGTHTEVLVEISNVVGLRLTVKKDGGRFFLFYQQFDCPVPDPNIVQKISCTNSFMKSSTCEFQCRGPKYMPIELGKSFNAVCRDDGSWSWNVTYACAKLDKILEICYGEGRSCDYKADYLARLLPEDDRIPLEHEKFEVLENAAQLQFLRNHAPKHGESLKSPPVFHTCNAQCLRSRATEAYLFECKSSDLTYRQKKECLKCRYAGVKCAGYVIYL